MPLVRGTHKFDNHFTQIPNAWLRDSGLSYKARGILAELLSHAKGFTVSRDRMARMSKEGKDAISSGIAELEAHGYLRREQTRLPNGTLGPTLWVTQDPTGPVNTAVEPLADYPAAVDPAAVDPHSKNNEVKNNNVKNTKLLESLENDFEKFWDIYPRRVARADAHRAFSKHYEKHGSKILEGAKRLAADPNAPADKKFIPYPATWLNREGWDDEPYPPRERTPEEIALRVTQRNEAERLEREQRQARQREEDKALEAAATEMPICEHGKKLIHCVPCCAKISDSA